jgi:hypothetical protein
MAFPPLQEEVAATPRGVAIGAVAGIVRADFSAVPGQTPRKTVALT